MHRRRSFPARKKCGFLVDHRTHADGRGRLLPAHEIVLKEARSMARPAAERGDAGTNDVLVGDGIRTNELQAWFIAEHVVDTPVVHME